MDNMDSMDGERAAAVVHSVHTVHTVHSFAAFRWSARCTGPLPLARSVVLGVTLSPLRRMGGIVRAGRVRGGQQDAEQIRKRYGLGTRARLFTRQGFQALERRPADSSAPRAQDAAPRRPLTSPRHAPMPRRRLLILRATRSDARAAVLLILCVTPRMPPRRRPADSLRATRCRAGSARSNLAARSRRSSRLFLPMTRRLSGLSDTYC